MAVVGGHRDVVVSGTMKSPRLGPLSGMRDADGPWLARCLSRGVAWLPIEGALSGTVQVRIDPRR